MIIDSLEKLSPFGVNKKEKNKIYINHLQSLSLHHYNHCKEYKKIIKNLKFKIKNKNKIEKIFIGTSSLWYTTKGINFFDQKLVVKGGSLYNQKLLEAAKRINDLNPDLYLMHPREGNELVGLLNKNIIINKGCLQGNENLINALNNSNKVKVYTERSGIIFDLGPDIDIIFVNTFDRFNDNYYQEFIDTFDTFRKQQNPKYKGSKKISY